MMSTLSDQLEQWTIDMAGNNLAAFRPMWEAIAETLDLSTVVVESVTADATIADDTTMVLADCTDASVTITLPTVTNRQLVFKRIVAGANDVTIDAAGSETIDGATTMTLDDQYSSVTIVGDGTSWHVVA